MSYVLDNKTTVNYLTDFYQYCVHMYLFMYVCTKVYVWIYVLLIMQYLFCAINNKQQVCLYVCMYESVYLCSAISKFLKSHLIVTERAFC